VENVPNDLGQGVFWWYPEALPIGNVNGESVWEGGRLGLFDQNGNLLPAASVFEQFLPTGLPGDYNGNDVVDAADYSAWRDALEGGATELLNDPTPGTVDESDFLYWRDHFGETASSGSGSGSGVAVPEPAAAVLLVVGLMPFLRRRRGAGCRPS